MRKSSANLSVVAARAAARQAVLAASTPRPDLTPVITGFTGTRRHGNKRSAKGGSATGGCTSVWAKTSPSFRTPSGSTHDSAYSQTVQNRNV